MKNYNSELRKKNYHVYGNGWEVQVIEGKPQFYTGIPREAKKEIRLKLAMQARIARCVSTKEDFDSLNKRIDKSDWKYIIENDLKGKDLVYWAFNTHTSQEYDNLLRYN